MAVEPDGLQTPRSGPLVINALWDYPRDYDGIFGAHAGNANRSTRPAHSPKHGDAIPPDEFAELMRARNGPPVTPPPGSQSGQGTSKRAALSNAFGKLGIGVPDSTDMSAVNAYIGRQGAGTEPSTRKAAAQASSIAETLLPERLTSQDAGPGKQRQAKVQRVLAVYGALREAITLRGGGGSPGPAPQATREDAHSFLSGLILGAEKASGRTPSSREVLTMISGRGAAGAAMPEHDDVASREWRPFLLNPQDDPGRPQDPDAKVDASTQTADEGAKGKKGKKGKEAAAPPPAVFSQSPQASVVPLCPPQPSVPPPPPPVLSKSADGSPVITVPALSLPGMRDLPELAVQLPELTPKHLPAPEQALESSQKRRPGRGASTPQEPADPRLPLYQMQYALHMLQHRVAEAESALEESRSSAARDQPRLAGGHESGRSSPRRARATDFSSPLSSPGKGKSRGWGVAKKMSVAVRMSRMLATPAQDPQEERLQHLKAVAITEDDFREAERLHRELTKHKAAKQWEQAKKEAEEKGCEPPPEPEEPQLDGIAELEEQIRKLEKVVEDLQGQIGDARLHAAKELAKSMMAREHEKRQLKTKLEQEAENLELEKKKVAQLQAHAEEQEVNFENLKTEFHMQFQQERARIFRKVKIFLDRQMSHHSFVGGHSHSVSSSSNSVLGMLEWLKTAERELEEDELSLSELQTRRSTAVTAFTRGESVVRPRTSERELLHSPQEEKALLPQGEVKRMQTTARVLSARVQNVRHQHSLVKEAAQDMHRELASVQAGVRTVLRSLKKGSGRDESEGAAALLGAVTAFCDHAESVMPNLPLSPRSHQNAEQAMSAVWEAGEALRALELGEASAACQRLALTWAPTYRLISGIAAAEFQAGKVAEEMEAAQQRLSEYKHQDEEGLKARAELGKMQALLDSKDDRIDTMTRQLQVLRDRLTETEREKQEAEAVWESERGELQSIAALRSAQPENEEGDDKKHARHALTALDELRLRLHEMEDPQFVGKILGELLRLHKELRPDADLGDFDFGSGATMLTPTGRDHARWQRWQKRMEALRGWQRASLECLCKLLTVEEAAQKAMKNRRMAVLVKRKIRSLEDFMKSAEAPPKVSPPAPRGRQYQMHLEADGPAAPLRAKMDMFYANAITGKATPSAFQLSQWSSTCGTTIGPFSTGSSATSEVLVRMSDVLSVTQGKQPAPLPGLGDERSAPLPPVPLQRSLTEKVLREAGDFSLPGLPLAVLREPRPVTRSAP